MDNDELNDSDPYKYTPLDTSKPSIRLLEILAQKRNGCIALSLTHVYLSDFRNQFHTLSYTWGPKEPTFQIFIDGKFAHVRKNIHLFLLHCYETAVIKVRWLWVDSICINQEDLDEKSKQVQMMSEIYANAYGTFIWLDEVSRVSQLAETYYECKAEASVRAKGADEMIDIADLPKLCFREMAGVREKQDVLEFGNHSYWTRLWIIQEIFLSYRVSLVLGTKLLLLDRESYGTLIEFGGSLRVIRHKDGQNNDRQGPKNEISWSPEFFARLALAFYGLQLDTRLSLLELIEQYHDYQCEQPRDKIFGLQGIAREGPQIHVDYKVSTLDLFIQCLRNHINQHVGTDSKREKIDLWKVRCLMDALKLPTQPPEITHLLQNMHSKTHLLMRVPRFTLALYPNTLYKCHSDPVHPSHFTKLVTHENSRWISYKPEDYNIDPRILSELADLTAPASAPARASNPQATYLKCCMPAADHEFILSISTSTSTSTSTSAQDTWSLFAMSATSPRLVKGNEPTGTLLRRPSLPGEVVLCMNVQFDAHREYLNNLVLGSNDTVPLFHVACRIEDLIYLAINDM